MRLPALTAALATALAGTGCIVTTNETSYGDVDLAWRFRDSDLAVAGNWSIGDTGCGTAAIADVRFTVRDAHTNGLVYDDVLPCVDGTGYPRAYLSGLAVGSYTYLVQAQRSGSVAFDAAGGFDVYANQVTTVDETLDVLPVAPLTVYFTPATCSGTPEIRYDLFTSGGTFIDSQYVPCTTSYGFTVAADQATGVNYGLDVYAVNATRASVRERCLLTVRHTGFPATVSLVNAPDANCGP